MTNTLVYLLKKYQQRVRKSLGFLYTKEQNKRIQTLNLSVKQCASQQEVTKTKLISPNERRKKSS